MTSFKADTKSDGKHLRLLEYGSLINVVGIRRLTERQNQGMLRSFYYATDFFEKARD